MTGETAKKILAEANKTRVDVKQPTRKAVSDWYSSDSDCSRSDSYDENSYSYKAWQLAEELNKHHLKRYDNLSEQDKKRFDTWRYKYAD